MQRRVLRTIACVTIFLANLDTVARSATIEHAALDAGVDGIVVSGEIVAGDEEKFRRLALEFPNAVVVLYSPGGALAPALEIGKLIHLRGYPTIVPSNALCASSCALIWLAGHLDWRFKARKSDFMRSTTKAAARRE